MTISLPFIFWLTFSHYIGDWVVQTRWQAESKSKSMAALSAHVGTYTFTLFWLLLCVGPYSSYTFPAMILYVLVNGAFHWLTDYVTSRINAHFWKSGQQGAFWAALGADGLIHLWTLLLTAQWLLTDGA